LVLPDPPVASFGLRGERPDERPNQRQGERADQRPGEQPGDCAAGFSAVAPTRLLDTRVGSAVGPALLAGPFAAGEVRHLPVLGVAGVPSAGVTAVAVNVGTVAPDGPSFLQLLPTSGATLGAYSNVNADAAGQVRANFAIVPVGANGRISIHH